MGRPKGTPNKKTVRLEEIALKQKCNPFEILCMFANGDWEALGMVSETTRRHTRQGDFYEVDRITGEMRMKAAAEAAQYLYPKRKSVELTEILDPNKDRPLKSISDDELDDL